MDIIMGVMILIILAGFFDSGSHHGMMMGGHEKNNQKNESAIHNHAKGGPSPDRTDSVDPQKDGGALEQKDQ